MRYYVALKKPDYGVTNDWFNFKGKVPTDVRRRQIASNGTRRTALRSI